MHFELEKTYLYVVLKLGATDKGHFYPEFHDMHRSVGSEIIVIIDSFLKCLRNCFFIVIGYFFYFLLLIIQLLNI
jgi:hypothetical protein